MKQLLITALITLFFSISYGQEKVGFLEEICVQIDQHLGEANVKELKEVLANEEILLYYELPSRYWSMLEFLELNEWEGPLHDSLRALIAEPFVSDFINTEDLVFQYYISYLSGKVFDVRAAVQVRWEEEMISVNAYRAEGESYYNSFQVGELIYFYPEIIKFTKPYPYELELMEEGPYEVIQCKVISKIDSTLSLEVQFVKNLKGLKRIADYINENKYFFIDAQNPDIATLASIKKNKSIIYNSDHFSKFPLTLDFRYLKFTSSCFQSSNERIKLERIDDNILDMQGNIFISYMVWKDGNVEYSGKKYKVVYDKKLQVQYLQNLESKEQLFPIPCAQLGPLKSAADPTIKETIEHPPNR